MEEGWIKGRKNKKNKHSDDPCPPHLQGFFQ